MPNKNSKAVVTGASGFIGQALVAHLQSTGWRVLAVDRRPFPDSKQLAMSVDVAQPDALARVVDSNDDDLSSGGFSRCSRIGGKSPPRFREHLPGRL